MKEERVRKDDAKLPKMRIGTGYQKWTYSRREPKFACKDCGRQFIENPEFKPISVQTKALVDKLLLERVSLAGIVRVTGVSARWLQSYVNGKYAAVARQVDVPAQKKDGA